MTEKNAQVCCWMLDSTFPNGQGEVDLLSEGCMQWFVMLADRKWQNEGKVENEGVSE